MEIIHNDEQLKKYINEAVKVSGKNPVLIDKFLKNAMEVDVDALSDGHEVLLLVSWNILKKQEFILEILLV